MRKFGLQSAMEYLMTYGWAILIIAVVLGVLYYIGVFNPNSFATSACTATPGFLCSNPVYSHTTGNIVVTLGQQTGATWTTANVAFLNATSEATVTSSTFNSFQGFSIPYVVLSSGIVPGETVQASIPVSGAVKTGTTISGTLWVQYTTSSSSGVLTTQLATVNLKAS